MERFSGPSEVGEMSTQMAGLLQHLGAAGSWLVQELGPEEED